MSIPRCLALVVVCWLCLLVFPRRTEFADDWQPIDPAELKMTSEPKAPGAPAIVLYRQVDRKDLGRANTEFNYLRIKILTEEGRKYANVEIPYDRSRASISSLKARTIHPDGNITNFDGKSFDQMIEKTHGTKYFAKTFTMPDVQVGSIIEYRYYIDFQDGYVFNSRWILSDELFTKKAVFSLVPYERFYLRWSWTGLPAGTTPPAQDARKVVRMTTQDIPALQYEDYMPPVNELKMRVDFVYSDESVETNGDKYWSNYGKKENGHVEDFVSKRKAIEAAIPGIVAAGDTPEQKLRKLYARSQQIRNLSYEPAKTVQEMVRDIEKIKTADDVWKNGYGFGYQITWVFLAMARAAGFEAHPVMVSGRSEYFFNPQRVNSAELDTNVVQIKLNGKEQYFDPGAAFTPFGLLPWPESGVTGRKLDRDGGVWVKTDLASSSDARTVRKADLKLKDDGTLEGKVTVSYEGLEALTRRSEYRNQDGTERKTYLENSLKQAIPAAAEVELKNEPDWKGPEGPLVAEFEVKIEGWVSGAGHRALLPVGLFSNEEKHEFEHASRVQAIYFPYLFQKQDDINIELPLDWKVTTVPALADKDAKGARYTLKVEQNKDVIHISRTVVSDVSIIPQASYAALRGFYSIVRTGDDGQVVLQPGASAAGK